MVRIAELQNYNDRNLADCGVCGGNTVLSNVLDACAFVTALHLAPPAMYAVTFQVDMCSMEWWIWHGEPQRQTSLAGVEAHCHG